MNYDKGVKSKEDEEGWVQDKEMYYALLSEAISWKRSGEFV